MTNEEAKERMRAVAVHIARQAVKVGATADTFIEVMTSFLHEQTSLAMIEGIDPAKAKAFHTEIEEMARAEWNRIADASNCAPGTA